MCCIYIHIYNFKQKSTYREKKEEKKTMFSFRKDKQTKPLQFIKTTATTTTRNILNVYICVHFGYTPSAHAAPFQSTHKENMYLLEMDNVSHKRNDTLPAPCAVYAGTVKRFASYRVYV